MEALFTISSRRRRGCLGGLPVPLEENKIPWRWREHRHWGRTPSRWTLPPLRLPPMPTDAGGISELRRWLSAAIPPGARSQLRGTPAGVRETIGCVKPSVTPAGWGLFWDTTFHHLPRLPWNDTVSHGDITVTSSHLGRLPGMPPATVGQNAPRSVTPRRVRVPPRPSAQPDRDPRRAGSKHPRWPRASPAE